MAGNLVLRVSAGETIDVIFPEGMGTIIFEPATGGRMKAVFNFPRSVEIQHNRKAATASGPEEFAEIQAAHDGCIYE